MTAASTSPFPLEGGRAGDGGEATRPAPASVARARRLRKQPTVAERMLWNAVRALKLNIRRQAPIGPYVVDFVHHGSRLVIEIDGYHHTTPEGIARDSARDAWLAAAGYRVMRIAEKRVRDDLETVVAEIERALNFAMTADGGAAPPSPALPPSRGKGDGPAEARGQGTAISLEGSVE